MIGRAGRLAFFWRLVWDHPRRWSARWWGLALGTALLLLPAVALLPLVLACDALVALPRGAAVAVLLVCIGWAGAAAPTATWVAIAIAAGVLVELTPDPKDPDG